MVVYPLFPLKAFGPYASRGGGAGIGQLGPLEELCALMDILWQAMAHSNGERESRPFFSFRTLTISF